MDSSQRLPSRALRFLILSAVVFQAISARAEEPSLRPLPPDKVVNSARTDGHGHRGKTRPPSDPVHAHGGHAMAAGKGMPRGGVVATFPAFQMLADGRSILSVELSARVPVQEHLSSQPQPQAITFSLPKAHVLHRNNRNPLVTTQFRTPVSRAFLHPTSVGVDLVVQLRARVHPTQRWIDAPHGGVRLEIEFPAGDYPTIPLSQPAHDGKDGHGSER